MPGIISEESRKRAAESRQARSVFDHYLEVSKPKRSESYKAKIDEIDATLVRGTRERNVPRWVEGKRDGTTPKMVALRPAERASLITKKQRLLEGMPTVGREELRAKFLEILLGYAASQGWTKKTLIEVGVPIVDIVAAGIKDPEDDQEVEL